jgi:hypothetical protein
MSLALPQRCGRNNDVHLAPDEVGRDIGEMLIASVRPPVFDSDGAPLAAGS